jgi:hypothetical protein
MKKSSDMATERWLAVLYACMFIATLATTAFTQTQRIRGEVIDVECYVAHEGKGESHKQCAITCIKGGQPAGILEEKTGKIYLIVTEDHVTNPSKKIMPYIAKMVDVDGTVKERNGISIIDIKEIKEVPSVLKGDAPKEKGA